MKSMKIKFGRMARFDMPIRMNIKVRFNRSTRWIRKNIKAGSNNMTRWVGKNIKVKSGMLVQLDRLVKKH